MPLVHAKDYSASASARWLNCPASVVEVRKYENKTSSAAEEGTCSHELAQIGLDFDCTYEELAAYEGKILNDAPTVAVNKEMVDYVWGYIEYCRSFTGVMFVEMRVDYSPWAEEGFGTSDCIVIGDERAAVIDLKYGKGIPVQAEGNTQAMLYALGVYNEFDMIYDFTHDYVFELHIYQPRRDNYSTWEVTVAELLEFGERVKLAVQESKSNNPKYQPTEKGCMWCAHKANCKALQTFTEETIGSMFDDLSLPAVEGVDVVNVLAAKPIIEAWLKAVEQHTFEQLNNGKVVEGFKLVAGRTSRKWLNEQSGISELSKQYDDDTLFTKKFITVPQAEKLVGKATFAEKFSELVNVSEGKPTLARADDKRPPIGDVTCEFDEL